MSWRIEDVTVAFGAHVALHEVALTIEPGRVHAVIGGDGAGKSTLLRVLAGLVVSRSGTHHLPARRHVGFVPAAGGVFGDLSVDENIGFVADAYRLTDWGERARMLLDSAGLTSFGDRLAGRLSGGQRRKLAGSMALLPRPELLLLDEVTRRNVPARCCSSTVAMSSPPGIRARSSRASPAPSPRETNPPTARRPGGAVGAGVGGIRWGRPRTVTTPRSRMPPSSTNSPRGGHDHDLRRGPWRNPRLRVVHRGRRRPPRGRTGRGRWTARRERRREDHADPHAARTRDRDVRAPPTLRRGPEPGAAPPGRLRTPEPGPVPRPDRRGEPRLPCPGVRRRIRPGRLGPDDAPTGLVGRLPLGAQRRAAFAAATQHRPALLILDEPTSGVSPLARSRQWDLIRRHAEEGVAVLVSTHHMEEAVQADRLVVMAHGRVVARGRPDEVVGDRRIIEVRADRWADAFAALDRGGLRLTLAGRTLRVLSGTVADVETRLQRAGVPAEVRMVAATLDETMVELSV